MYHRFPVFIPQSDSLSYTRPTTSYEAAPFALCYGLRFWPAPLAKYSPYYNAGFHGTVSGQVQPVCYHTNPPSAYISKKVIDMITSFQVIR